MNAAIKVVGRASDVAAVSTSPRSCAEDNNGNPTALHRRAGRGHYRAKGNLAPDMCSRRRRSSLLVGRVAPPTAVDFLHGVDHIRGAWETALLIHGSDGASPSHPSRFFGLDFEGPAEGTPRGVRMGKTTAVDGATRPTNQTNARAIETHRLFSDAFSCRDKPIPSPQVI
jgi:hypothetical protein